MSAKLTCLIVALVVTVSAPSVAQTPSATAAEPIRYTVSFPAPHTNYVAVAAEVPTSGRAQVELMMPVWTPGSYLVRDYERNVEAVTASASGRSLPVAKSTKNHWRVTTGGAPVVSVAYRVYSREMSVRTNWVDAGFAILNGAPTFMTLADGMARAHEVTVMPAAGWRRVISPMAEVAGAAFTFRAPDYDTLVDSPILAGNPAVYEFTVEGKTHYLVNEGEGGVFDGRRAVRDLETIVRTHLKMWGSLPYDKYVFFNLLTLATGSSGGGLEHKNAATLLDWRFATRTRQSYLSWLQLASHEYFHAWNVKRLRPVELGPFNYDAENQTRSLWIAEGITDYYGDLAVLRAGLSTRDEFLASLSNKIENLQNTPGRLVQSAEMASFDAWIRYYRPDENSVNVSISYYTKGAVLGFILDAKVRQATRGSKSLDDVMRAAYAKYSGPRGYTPEEFRAVAEQVAATSLKTFWEAAVESPGELDYRDALDTFGLQFRPAPPAGDAAYLGIATRNDGGRLVITQVRRATPALTAGLNVDDEILAIDDIRVRPDRLDDRLAQYRAGDKVAVLLARRDQLMRLDVTFGTVPPRQWRLELAPGASETQTQQRTRWLTLPA